MNNWTLHNADCRDILPTLPTASIDAAICDPPYPHIKRNYGTWTEDEWFALMQAVVPELQRILTPTGSAVIILQANSEHVGTMRPWLWKFMAWVSEQWNVIQDVYWHNNSTPPTRHCNRKYGLMRPAVKTCVWLGPPDCYRNQDAVLLPLGKSTRRLLENGRATDDTLRYSPKRTFVSEAEKFEIAVAANAKRRPHLNGQQKRVVIANYLKADAAIADSHLGELLGVSKNTVAAVREELEAVGQIDELTVLRGKDGKFYPREKEKQNSKKPIKGETYCRRATSDLVRVVECDGADVQVQPLDCDNNPQGDPITLPFSELDGPVTVGAEGEVNEDSELVETHHNADNDKPKAGKGKKPAKGKSARTKANGDGETKGGKVAETGGRKKAAAKEAAKKTLPTIADDDEDEDLDAQEEGWLPEEDEGFDAWAVLDEFSKRNNWDHQRQVQTMVEFFQTDALNVLLWEVADESEFKEFLAEQETLPPPKEDGDWPLGTLGNVRNRLEHLLPEMKAVDWAKESAADYLERLDEIVAAVEELRRGVPHA